MGGGGEAGGPGGRGSVVSWVELVVHSLRGPLGVLVAQVVLRVRSMLTARSMLVARRAEELSLPLSVSALRTGLSTTETIST